MPCETGLRAQCSGSFTWNCSNIGVKQVPNWGSAQKVDPGEEKAPAGTQTCNLLIMSPVLQPLSCPCSPKLELFYCGGHGPVSWGAGVFGVYFVNCQWKSTLHVEMWEFGLLSGPEPIEETETLALSSFCAVSLDFSHMLSQRSPWYNHHGWQALINSFCSIPWSEAFFLCCSFCQKQSPLQSAKFAHQTQLSFRLSLKSYLLKLFFVIVLDQKLFSSARVFFVFVFF